MITGINQNNAFLLSLTLKLTPFLSLDLFGRGSCEEYREADDIDENIELYIDVDGVLGSLEPVLVYCDVETYSGHAITVIGNQYW